MVNNYPGLGSGIASTSTPECKSQLRLVAYNKPHSVSHLNQGSLGEKASDTAEYKDFVHSVSVDIFNHLF